MLGTTHEIWARLYADEQPEVQASRLALAKARRAYDVDRKNQAADQKAARKRFAAAEREHRRVLHGVMYAGRR